MKDQNGKRIKDASFSNKAQNQSASASTSISLRQNSVPNSSNQALDLEAGKKFVWEYKGDAGWEPYSDSIQIELEAEFQGLSESQNKNGKRFLIIIGRWKYEIDLTKMIQENISHSNRRQRPIRRRVEQLI